MSYQDKRKSSLRPMNDFSKKTRERSVNHEWLIFRPKNLPEGWEVLEQQDSYKSSFTSFVKWCKIHHNDEPRRLWIVFNQFNPHVPGERNSYDYSVKAGRHIKPAEILKGFNDLKDVQAYMIYLMEKTDKWIEEINSEKYITAYNERIAKLVESEEKRKRRITE